ncbi:MAG: DUF4093 domain-containing protein [Oscillospiraceae bacterium]|nr:DUF4093 domain-containing protein [Oscillospiraceae bacterium]
MQKLHISGAIVVEGRYDKAKLSRLVDCPIVVVNGFGVFKDQESVRLLRYYSENGGLIVLTDSDSAGFRIRGHIKGIINKGNVRCAYIPDIYGKEKRKATPSAEGKLGVEGMPDNVLLEVLKPFSEEQKPTNSRIVTKMDFYEDGFTGRPDSSKRRDELKLRLNLPERLNVNGLLEAINRTIGYEEYRQAADEINKG